jgi:hypothetical protein
VDVVSVLLAAGAALEAPAYVSPAREDNIDVCSPIIELSLGRHSSAQCLRRRPHRGSLCVVDSWGHPWSSRICE